MTNGYRLSTSQLGFRPSSPKSVTLTAPEGETPPERIPFYVHRVPAWFARDGVPEGWTSRRLPWPYDIADGRMHAGTPSSPGNAAGVDLHHGELVRRSTRWGTVWQASFSDFTQPGLFHIETQQAFSGPFAIDERVYDRLSRGLLVSLYTQRSAFAVPGVRAARHLDDAVRDADGRHVPHRRGVEQRR